MIQSEQSGLFLPRELVIGEAERTTQWASIDDITLAAWDAFEIATGGQIALEKQVMQQLHGEQPSAWHNRHGSVDEVLRKPIFFRVQCR